MRAVILAAEDGSGLRPLTDSMPKTMAMVAGERVATLSAVLTVGPSWNAGGPQG